MGKLSSNGHRHNNKILSISKKNIYIAPIFVLCNFQQHFEIETDASDYALGAVITQSGHQSPFILKLSMTLLEGTRRMKRNCIPFWKLLIHGDTTSLERKRSSSLTISPCSSPCPTWNYKQLDDSSGLITNNNFSW